MKAFFAARRRYLWRLGLLSVAMFVAAHGVFGRFVLGLQAGRTACLPYRVFVIDRSDRVPARAAYFAFRSEGLQPFFDDGTVFVKRVAGLPGDEFLVDMHVYVNGVRHGPLSAQVLRALGRRPNEVNRREVVPPGRLVMLGTLPLAYDSRYFGTIDGARLIGRAYPIL